MVRKPIKLEITEYLLETLTILIRSLKLERRYSDRANVIILSSKGNTIDAIMKKQN